PLVPPPPPTRRSSDLNLLPEQRCAMRPWNQTMPPGRERLSVPRVVSTGPPAHATGAAVWPFRVLQTAASYSPLGYHFAYRNTGLFPSDRWAHLWPASGATHTRWPAEL